MKQRLASCVLLLLVSFNLFGQDSSHTFLYAGSYTSGEEGEGIYVYSLNSERGELIEVQRLDSLINPSFITLSTNGQFLYACTETRLDKFGSISVFKIDSLSGQLTFINKQSTEGRNPVHVVSNSKGEYVLASNYTDAGIAIFHCNLDGSIAPLTELIPYSGGSALEGRQSEAHIHSCNFSPDNKFAFAPDLGADKIRVLAFEKSGLIRPVDSLTIETEKGAGPRHFVFHPDKLNAYCIQELNGTIAHYTYNEGQLELIDSYKSYKASSQEYASADIHISPDGKFLYASNRQEEHSISIFHIDQESGKLNLTGHQSTFGKTPRSFVIDPSGKFLIVANQATDELVVFERSLVTGLLLKISTTKGLKSPSSLKVVRFNNYPP